MARGQAASAGALLATVKREAGEGWAPGLTVLTGADLYHLDQAQRAILDSLVAEGASDFAVTIYGDQRVDVGTVVSAARSVGMFAERRVVLVRDLGALEGEPDALVAYAGDPPPASYLIVRAPQLDRRRKLHQALVKSGRELKFEASAAQDPAALAADVGAMARARGLEIDREAAVMLAEMCAGDYYRVDTELEKIATWSANREERKVTPLVLHEVGVGSAALSGWEAAGALLRADRPAAIAALRRLLDAGDEPLRVLGGLAYRARGMLQARAMIEGGAPPMRAVRAARLWGEPPADAARGLARYSMSRVLRFPSLLLEADRTLKSRSLAPGAVLGHLIDGMIGGAKRDDR